jgi:type IV pilus assembly protein PilY1
MKTITSKQNYHRKKIIAATVEKIFAQTFSQTKRALIFYPMIGFYAFLQPITSHGQYIPDIDQITKVEQIVESNLPFYVFQGRTPNIMMPFSVEWPITSAAWRYPEIISDVQVSIDGQVRDLKNIYQNNSFLPERNYTGYFNPTGCYSYDTTNQFFKYTQQNDSLGACPTNQFAGGALNWASLTTLDLARYALTGGNRVVDLNDQTIIERSRVFTWANDVFFDFDPNKTLWTIPEHTKRFPIKVFDVYGINGRGTSRVKYSRTCGTTLYVTRNNDIKQLLTHADCAQLDMTNIDRYEMRVQVCDPVDANSRPQYCKRYPSGYYKPIGVLQNKSATSRIGTMGYLNYGRDIVNDLISFGKKPRMPDNIPPSKFENEADNNKKLEFWLGERIRHLSGGVLRAPNKFLGESYYNDQLNFADNPLKEFDPETGIILDKDAGERLLEATGIEAPNQGGPSVIAYTNKFGRNNYVETDDLTELTSEALRYMSNQNSPSAPAHVPNNVSGDMTRQPFYFKRVWGTGSDGVTNLPNQKLDAGQYNTVIQKHYDYFPVISSWNWKKTPTDSLPDEPIRTKCEAQNIPRLIMLSDVNNWHGTAGYNSAGQFQTTTQIIQDNVLTNGDLRYGLNTYVNANKAITNGDLSEAQPAKEITQDPLSPKYTHPTQNRYLVSAMTALANLDGVNYKSNAMNQVTPRIRIKSSMIDVGEPLLTSLMSTNQTKPESNGKPEDCHLFYAGALGTANSLSEFVSQFGSNACQDFLNARDQNLNDLEATMPHGYFYPSNPQKMINNIRQAFEIPFEISGNLQVGALGEISSTGDSVSLFQFYLDVLQNRREQTSHLRSLPKKFTVSNTINGNTITEQPNWASNLYNSMRQYADRTVFVGLEKLDEDIARDARRYKNFSLLTNASTEFSGNILETREKMTERLINFLRGDISSEGTIFRSRSLAGAANSLISSTQNSNPLVLKKTSPQGSEMLYISSNDGMLHAINAQTGNIRFSYIPQNLAAKVSQTAMEGYQNANLFESFLVGGRVYDKNDELRVVAGGFGLGQKGVFALDVTAVHKTNDQFDASNVLFEFTDKDDFDVGHIIGQPELLTFNKTLPTGAIERQSYLAFTSGYKYDGETLKTPHLFLLKINHEASRRGLGINKTWVLNQDYFKVPITASGFTRKQNNGLTMPQSFIFDQKVVASYVGDLYGNLWKITNLDRVITGGNATVVRLYEGLNNVGPANGSQLQPITAKPNVVASELGGVMVTFGTGRLLGINDLGNKNHTPQAIYGIRDYNDATNLKKADLAQHVINDNLTLTQAIQDKERGWMLQLPDQNKGMRSTTTPRIINGTLLFSTQASGQFSINDCGENTGGFGTADVETGRPNNNNQAFARYNKVIGEILVLPPLRNNNNNSFTGTGSGVYITQTPVNSTVILGAATATITPTTPQTTSVRTTSRGGVLSWRMIQNED